MSEQEFIQRISKHQAIIRKVCNLYCNSSDEREDLYQEIVLQLWKSVKRFQGDSAFSTWMYRVALNTAISSLRKKKRKPNFQPITDLRQQIPDSPPDFTIEAQTQELYQAINHLSEIDKALVMLYIEDYSYKQIGEMIGITENYVAVKMSRVKNKLKKMCKVV